MKIDNEPLPQHIEVIMDSNGRWANQHTIGRIRGYKKGYQNQKEVPIGTFSCNLKSELP
jgi:undecaprenyl diphosphate synthase